VHEFSVLCELSHEFLTVDVVLALEFVVFGVTLLSDSVENPLEKEECHFVFLANSQLFKWVCLLFFELFLLEEVLTNEIVFVTLGHEVVFVDSWLSCAWTLGFRIVICPF
jgi:hypothetical protein